MKTNSLPLLKAAAMCLLLCTAGSLAAAELSVTTRQATLHAGPGTAQPARQELRAGDQVEALGWNRGYVRVRTAGGAEGWVHAAPQGWSEKQVRRMLDAPAKPEAGQEAAVEPSPSPWANAKVVTLADLGFRRGHHFEGARSVHALTFGFPLPREGSTGDARLRLIYQASSLIDQRSTLRVDVGGRPLGITALKPGDAPSSLDLVVPRSELRGRGVLPVTVRVSVIASEDRCFDERQLALHFVQLLPESRLELRPGSPGDSVRAAWAMLPRAVRISVPVPLDDGSAQTLMQVAGQLVRNSHQVSAVALPEVGDLVVAKGEQIKSLATAGWIAAGAAEANVLLLRGPQGRQALAVTESAGARLLGVTEPGWQDLPRADAHAHAPGMAEPPMTGDWIDFNALGADTSVRYLGTTTEWNLRVAPPRVPGDWRMKTVRVNLVSAPETEERQSQLYLFLNGVLQEIRKIENDGRPHSFGFAIPESSARVADNNLRLAVQRVTSDVGDCRGPMPVFPIQLLPGSAVQFEKHDKAPEQFSDLAATFAGGMDVWLTPAVAAKPQAYMGLLATFVGRPGIPLHRLGVRILTPGARFSPERPFMLVGRHDQDDPEAPVRFDRGRVRLVDSQQRILLDVDPLPRVTVAQIARHNGKHGLWVVPFEHEPPADPERFVLANDDVAFLDEDGVIVTWYSKYRSLAQIEYPDYVSWFDLLQRYRFWLIVAGWTAVILLLLFLYRKAREHRGQA